MILPRCTRWPFQLCPFRRLSVGCSRRSAADTDRSTSVDRTLFSDPARSPPAIRCGASSGGDDRTTKSDCRDLLGHHRSSEQYDEHRTTPTAFRNPGNAHPPSRTANALRCGTVAVLASLPQSSGTPFSSNKIRVIGAVARQHPRGIDTDRAHPIRPRETQAPRSTATSLSKPADPSCLSRTGGDRDVWFHSAFDRTQPRSLVPAQQFAKPVRPS